MEVLLYTGLEQVQAPEPAQKDAKADEGDQKPTHSQQFYAWRKNVKRVNGLKDKLSKKSKALEEMREALQWAEKEYRAMEEELSKAQKEAEEAQAVHAEAVKSSGAKAGDEPAKADMARCTLLHHHARPMEARGRGHADAAWPIYADM